MGSSGYAISKLETYEATLSEVGLDVYGGPRGSLAGTLPAWIGWWVHSYRYNVGHIVYMPGVYNASNQSTSFAPRSGATSMTQLRDELKWPQTIEELVAHNREITGGDIFEAARSTGELQNWQRQYFDYGDHTLWIKLFGHLGDNATNNVNLTSDKDFHDVAERRKHGWYCFAELKATNDPATGEKLKIAIPEKGVKGSFGNKSSGYIWAGNTLDVYQGAWNTGFREVRCLGGSTDGSQINNTDIKLESDEVCLNLCDSFIVVAASFQSQPANFIVCKSVFTSPDLTGATPRKVHQVAIQPIDRLSVGGNVLRSPKETSATDIVPLRGDQDFAKDETGGVEKYTIISAGYPGVMQPQALFRNTPNAKSLEEGELEVKDNIVDLNNFDADSLYLDEIKFQKIRGFDPRYGESSNSLNTYISSAADFHMPTTKNSKNRWQSGKAYKMGEWVVMYRTTNEKNTSQAKYNYVKWVARLDHTSDSGSAPPTGSGSNYSPHLQNDHWRLFGIMANNPNTSFSLLDSLYNSPNDSPVRVTAPYTTIIAPDNPTFSFTDFNAWGNILGDTNQAQELKSEWNDLFVNKKRIRMSEMSGSSKLYASLTVSPARKWGSKTYYWRNFWGRRKSETFRFPPVRADCAKADLWLYTNNLRKDHAGQIAYAVSFVDYTSFVWAQAKVRKTGFWTVLFGIALCIVGVINPALALGLAGKTFLGTLAGAWAAAGVAGAIGLGAGMAIGASADYVYGRIGSGVAQKKMWQRSSFAKVIRTIGTEDASVNSSTPLIARAKDADGHITIGDDRSNLKEDLYGDWSQQYGQSNNENAENDIIRFSFDSLYPYLKESKRGNTIFITGEYQFIIQDLNSALAMRAHFSYEEISRRPSQSRKDSFNNSFTGVPSGASESPWGGVNAGLWNTYQSAANDIVSGNSGGNNLKLITTRNYFHYLLLGPVGMANPSDPIMSKMVWTMDVREDLFAKLIGSVQTGFRGLVYGSDNKIIDYTDQAGLSTDIKGLGDYQEYFTGQPLTSAPAEGAPGYEMDIAGEGQEATMLRLRRGKIFLEEVENAWPGTLENTPPEGWQVHSSDNGTFSVSNEKLTIAGNMEEETEGTPAGHYHIADILDRPHPTWHTGNWDQGNNGFEIIKGHADFEYVAPTAADSKSYLAINVTHSVWSNMVYFVMRLPISVIKDQRYSVWCMGRKSENLGKKDGGGVYAGNQMGLYVNSSASLSNQITLYTLNSSGEWSEHNSKKLWFNHSIGSAEAHFIAESTGTYYLEFEIRESTNGEAIGSYESGKGYKVEHTPRGGVLKYIEVDQVEYRDAEQRTIYKPQQATIKKQINVEANQGYTFNVTSQADGTGKARWWLGDDTGSTSAEDGKIYENTSTTEPKTETVNWTADSSRPLWLYLQAYPTLETSSTAAKSIFSDIKITSLGYAEARPIEHVEDLEDAERMEMLSLGLKPGAFTANLNMDSVKLGEFSPTPPDAGLDGIAGISARVTKAGTWKLMIESESLSETSSDRDGVHHVPSRKIDFSFDVLPSVDTALIPLFFFGYAKYIPEYKYIHYDKYTRNSIVRVSSSIIPVDASGQKTTRENIRVGGENVYKLNKDLQKVSGGSTAYYDAGTVPGLKQDDNWQFLGFSGSINTEGLRWQVPEIRDGNNPLSPGDDLLEEGRCASVPILEDSSTGQLFTPTDASSLFENRLNYNLPIIHDGDGNLTDPYETNGNAWIESMQNIMDSPNPTHLFDAGRTDDFEEEEYQNDDQTVVIDKIVISPISNLIGTNTISVWKKEASYSEGDIVAFEYTNYNYMPEDLDAGQLDDSFSSKFWLFARATKDITSGSNTAPPFLNDDPYPEQTLGSFTKDSDFQEIVIPISTKYWECISARAGASEDALTIRTNSKDLYSSYFGTDLQIMGYSLNTSGEDKTYTIPTLGEKTLLNYDPEKMALTSQDVNMFFDGNDELGQANIVYSTLGDQSLRSPGKFESNVLTYKQEGGLWPGKKNDLSSQVLTLQEWQETGEAHENPIIDLFLNTTRGIGANWETWVTQDYANKITLTQSNEFAKSYGPPQASILVKGESMTVEREYNSNIALFHRGRPITLGISAKVYDKTANFVNASSARNNANVNSLDLYIAVVSDVNETVELGQYGLSGKYTDIEREHGINAVFSAGLEDANQGIENLIYREKIDRIRDNDESGNFSFGNDFLSKKIKYDSGSVGTTDKFITVTFPENYNINNPENSFVKKTLAVLATMDDYSDEKQERLYIEQIAIDNTNDSSQTGLNFYFSNVFASGSDSSYGINLIPTSAEEGGSTMIKSNINSLPDVMDALWDISGSSDSFTDGYIGLKNGWDGKNNSHYSDFAGQDYSQLTWDPFGLNYLGDILLAMGDACGRNKNAEEIITDTNVPDFFNESGQYIGGTSLSWTSLSFSEFYLISQSSFITESIFQADNADNIYTYREAGDSGGSVRLIIPSARFIYYQNRNNASDLVTKEYYESLHDEFGLGGGESKLDFDLQYGYKDQIKFGVEVYDTIAGPYGDRAWRQINEVGPNDFISINNEICLAPMPPGISKDGLNNQYSDQFRFYIEDGTGDLGKIYININDSSDIIEHDAYSALADSEKNNYSLQNYSRKEYNFKLEEIRVLSPDRVFLDNTRSSDRSRIWVWEEAKNLQYGGKGVALPIYIDHPGPFWPGPPYDRNGVPNEKRVTVNEVNYDLINGAIRIDDQYQSSTQALVELKDLLEYNENKITITIDDGLLQGIGKSRDLNTGPNLRYDGPDSKDGMPHKEYDFQTTGLRVPEANVPGDIVFYSALADSSIFSHRFSTTYYDENVKPLFFTNMLSSWYSTLNLDAEFAKDIGINIGKYAGANDTWPIIKFSYNNSNTYYNPSQFTNDPYFLEIPGFDPVEKYVQDSFSTKKFLLREHDSSKDNGYTVLEDLSTSFRKTFYPEIMRQIWDFGHTDGYPGYYSWEHLDNWDPEEAFNVGKFGGQALKGPAGARFLDGTFYMNAEKMNDLLQEFKWGMLYDIHDSYKPGMWVWDQGQAEWVFKHLGEIFSLDTPVIHKDVAFLGKPFLTNIDSLSSYTIAEFSNEITIVDPFQNFDLSFNLIYHTNVDGLNVNLSPLGSLQIIDQATPDAINQGSTFNSLSQESQQEVLWNMFCKIDDLSWQSQKNNIGATLGLNESKPVNTWINKAFDLDLNKYNPAIWELQIKDDDSEEILSSAQEFFMKMHLKPDEDGNYSWESETNWDKRAFAEQHTLQFKRLSDNKIFNLEEWLKSDYEELMNYNLFPILYSTTIPYYEGFAYQKNSYPSNKGDYRPWLKSEVIDLFASYNKRAVTMQWFFDIRNHERLAYKVSSSTSSYGGPDLYLGSIELSEGGIETSDHQGKTYRSSADFDLRGRSDFTAPDIPIPKNLTTTVSNYRDTFEGETYYDYFMGNFCHTIDPPYDFETGANLSDTQRRRHFGTGPKIMHTKYTPLKQMIILDSSGEPQVFNQEMFYPEIEIPGYNVYRDAAWVTWDSEELGVNEPCLWSWSGLDGAAHNPHGLEQCIDLYPNLMADLCFSGPAFFDHDLVDEHNVSVWKSENSTEPTNYTDDTVENQGDSIWFRKSKSLMAPVISTNISSSSSKKTSMTRRMSEVYEGVTQGTASREDGVLYTSRLAGWSTSNPHRSCLGENDSPFDDQNQYMALVASNATSGTERGAKKLNSNLLWNNNANNNVDIHDPLSKVSSGYIGLRSSIREAQNDYEPVENSSGTPDYYDRKQRQNETVTDQNRKRISKAQYDELLTNTGSGQTDFATRITKVVHGVFPGVTYRLYVSLASNSLGGESGARVYVVEPKQGHDPSGAVDQDLIAYGEFSHKLCRSVNYNAKNEWGGIGQSTNFSSAIDRPFYENTSSGFSENIAFPEGTVIDADSIGEKSLIKKDENRFKLYYVEFTPTLGSNLVEIRIENAFILNTVNCTASLQPSIASAAPGNWNELTEQEMFDSSIVSQKRKSWTPYSGPWVNNGLSSSESIIENENQTVYIRDAFITCVRPVYKETIKFNVDCPQRAFEVSLGNGDSENSTATSVVLRENGCNSDILSKLANDSRLPVSVDVLDPPVGSKGGWFEAGKDYEVSIIRPHTHFMNWDPFAVDFKNRRAFWPSMKEVVDEGYFDQSNFHPNLLNGYYFGSACVHKGEIYVQGYAQSKGWLFQDYYTNSDSLDSSLFDDPQQKGINSINFNSQPGDLGYNPQGNYVEFSPAVSGLSGAHRKGTTRWTNTADWDPMDILKGQDQFWEHKASSSLPTGYRYQYNSQVQSASSGKLKYTGNWTDSLFRFPFQSETLTETSSSFIENQDNMYFSDINFLLNQYFLEEASLGSPIKRRHGASIDFSESLMSLSHVQFDRIKNRYEDNNLEEIGLTEFFIGQGSGAWSGHGKDSFSYQGIKVNRVFQVITNSTSGEDLGVKLDTFNTELNSDIQDKIGSNSLESQNWVNAMVWKPENQGSEENNFYSFDTAVAINPDFPICPVLSYNGSVVANNQISSWDASKHSFMNTALVSFTSVMSVSSPDHEGIESACTFDDVKLNPEGVGRIIFSPGSKALQCGVGTFINFISRGAIFDDVLNLPLRAMKKPDGSGSAYIADHYYGASSPIPHEGMSKFIANATVVNDASNLPGAKDRRKYAHGTYDNWTMEATDFFTDGPNFEAIGVTENFDQYIKQV